MILASLPARIFQTLKRPRVAGEVGRWLLQYQHVFCLPARDGSMPPPAALASASPARASGPWRLRRGGQSASPKDQGGRTDAMPTPLPGYLLPKPLRRLFQILGCLIFYGQFTSIALCRVATDPQLGAHVPRHWHAARDLRRLVLHFSFPCHGPDRDSAWEQASPGSREARDCGRGALGL